MSDNKFYHRPAVDWCILGKNTLFDLGRGDVVLNEATDYGHMKPKSQIIFDPNSNSTPK